MSKHRTNGAILRRLLSGALCLALLLGLLPAGLITTAEAHWADPYVKTLVDWGVMRGDISGNLSPERSITRAEFVTMMNRAYGYTKTAGHPFIDVRSRDWYNEDIDIAYNIGYFQGTSPTKASPQSPLTREQAAVLLARNMMMQETVGETLGFSDSRTLEEWSRGLVGAATQSGILSGYKDGSFKPKNNISRGEVAAMLVRAIGTPIQTAGDHALGNVYGNVTVNTSGVKLRDGVIAGNLYLTGGIDLGEVLLENVTVLGEIIVSGGGESNSSQSSIIMRNVEADGMTVDSIGSQFVTIRAEGNTNIPTATVRTNAYVDDSSLPGYGLWKIVQDGGKLLQVAGNVKEVWNQTPDSRLEVVQGAADKVTVDEKATGSTVLVDGDARVDDLNLDTGTTVIGKGDIGKLNVGAPGSTVEQLPDKIEIRPGIETDINGGTMDSSQAAESSNDPKLLAGYPAVKNIAPASATLVFRTNKPGTVYWAVSAVADGSVNETDLMEPPVYGGKILQSGTVTATAANTDYTAEVANLTKDGSYYVTAMLVDGRDKHSPIKVTSFTTPDDTVPAFADGYPVMSKVTCDQAQVTVMTNKSCQLYYALLPAGSTAPTPAEFKAAAIPGNLGYGSQSVTKNVTTPINVNTVRLDEETDYVLYLWLTDHDGAKSSAVVAVPFATPDETPPIVTDVQQVDETPTSIKVSYTIDEPADFVWAIVTEGDHMAKRLLDWTDETFEVGNEDKSTLKFKDETALLAAKVRLISGTGAVASGTSTRSPLDITKLPTTTSSYVLYYIADDNATETGNLSTQIKALRVHTEDNIPPTVTATFTNPDGSLVPSTERPRVNADIRLIFSESVRGGTSKDYVFKTLYDTMKKAEEAFGGRPIIDDGNLSEEDKELLSNYNTARKALGDALDTYFKMYSGTPDGQHEEVKVRGKTGVTDDNWVVDWRNAEVTMLDDGTGRVEVLLRGEDDLAEDGKTVLHPAALNLGSGESYYFHLANIWDLAVIPNALNPSPCDVKFTTAFAQVILDPGDELLIGDNAVDKNGAPLTLKDAANNGGNDEHRIDYHFTADPVGVDDVKDNNIRWDMLIWADTSMEITLYERPQTTDNSQPWIQMGKIDIPVARDEGFAYKSVGRWIGGEANPTPDYGHLKEMKHDFSRVKKTDTAPVTNSTGVREYAIHINKLGSDPDASAWNRTVSIRASIVAGTQSVLSNQVINGATEAEYNEALNLGTISVGTPDPFTMSKLFTDSRPPEISDRPNITLEDVGATIDVFLDRPGQIYYLVIPLSQLSNAGGAVGGTSQILESQLQTVGINYTPGTVVLKAADNSKPELKDIPQMTGGGTITTPTLLELKVSTPVRETFIDERDPGGGVLRGSTGRVTAYTKTTIDLSGQLAPNTVYLVCMLTRGVSAVYDTTAYCYRFTTKMPQRPILKLMGNTPTEVNAEVDRTCNVRSVLLSENGLNTQNYDILLSSTKFYSATANTNGDFGYVRKDLKDDFLVLAKDTSKYSVRQALYDSYGKGNDCSVFDYFATDAAKEQVLALITNTGATNVVKGYTPEELVTVREGKETLPLSFRNMSLQGENNYICLAYAQGTTQQGATTAAVTSFRVTYPITNADDSGPELLSATSSIAYADGKTQGRITLVFNKTLYNGDTGNLLPLTQTAEAVWPKAPATATHVGITAFADISANLKIVENPGRSIDTMTFEVSDPDSAFNNVFTITVSGVSSIWGTPLKPARTVTVTRTGEAPNYTFVLTMK